jgi:hypothetical protein
MRCSGLVAILLAAVLGTVQGGCATTWALVELSQDRPPLETREATATVPLPGATERLAVDGYLLGKPSQSTVDPPRAGRSDALLLECKVTQTGPELEYRAATRYGTSWKVATAIAFVVEGGITALAYSKASKVSDQVVVGLLGADALATGVLFFVPERDVYESKRRSNTLTVREGCPEGLALEAAGQSVPIAPDGTAGEAGQKLLEAQMGGPAQPALRLRLAGYAADVPISAANRCAWAAARLGAEQTRAFCAGTSVSTSTVQAGLDLPLGTATGAGSAPDLSAGPR